MKWLIWKEYRANRLVLIAGAVLLAAPYLFLLGLVWYGPIHRSELRFVAVVGAIYSAAISQLTLTLLGGNVIAGERADRSAEFLAYLPISRSRALAGKLTLVGMTVALIWIPNLLVIFLGRSSIPETMRPDRDFELIYTVIFHIAVTGAVLFSVAWLLSSILESPTFSICGGLVTPALIVTAILLSCSVLDIPAEAGKPWYVGICLVLAPTCFVAGTAYYLRRVEP